MPTRKNEIGKQLMSALSLLFLYPPLMMIRFGQKNRRVVRIPFVLDICFVAYDNTRSNLGIYKVDSAYVYIYIYVCILSI